MAHLGFWGSDGLGGFAGHVGGWVIAGFGEKFDLF